MSETSGLLASPDGVQFESRFSPHEVGHESTNGDSHPVAEEEGELIPHSTKKALTALTLLGVLYSNCIGSGYGFEDAIGAAGPLVTLIFCLIVPWIWCLPTGLAVSELSTAIRSNSGILMWVNVSFNPVVSFMCILMTIFICFVGNATYPSLAASYIRNIIPLDEGTKAAVKIGCVVICAALNISGVEIVGGVSVLMSVITTLPFVIFSVKQLFSGGYSWDCMTSGNFSAIDWPTFLSIASWNYANLENAGSVVEEVAHPKKTLFRAMIPLMFMTYAAYFFPVAAGSSATAEVVDGVAICAGKELDLWVPGYWFTIGEIICGSYVKYMLYTGAIVTSFGYTMTSICCTSRLLAGIGSMEVFPHKISKFIGAYHPKLKTPVNAILVNSVVTLAFSLTLSFTQVVALAQALYCVRLLFVYFAAIRLRMEHPTLPRPYAMPCGLLGCVLFLAPAILFSAAVAVLSAQSSLGIGMGTLSFFVVGPIVSFVYVKYVRPQGFEGRIIRVPIRASKGPILLGGASTEDAE